MSSALVHLLSGWLGVAVFMLGLWWFAMWRSNAGWVDVGWGFSLVLLVLACAGLADGQPVRRALLLGLTSLWGLRLTLHILLRLLLEQDEDPRYRMLREHWGESARWHFLFFFQAQGLASVVLTIPVYLLMSSRDPGLTAFDLLGAVIIVGAVAGEALADRQLLLWKANPDNTGRTCRQGLWAVSRHPNYFFEWVHWLGYPVLGLSLLGTPLAAWWPLTLLGPVLMLVAILRFTGIPYTETRALATRGEDYRRYQREVSAFFPWFPRKGAEP